MTDSHRSLRQGASEATIAAFLFAAHFLIVAFQYSAKAVRQASYVDALGAERLPYVYLATAVLSLPAVLLFQRLARTWCERTALVRAALAAAAGHVVFWWLFSLDTGFAWVSALFYLWTAVVGVLLVSLSWTYTAALLDPRQARRLYGIVGAGGLLGSVAGGQVARLAAGLLETRHALLWGAGILAAAAVLLARGAEGGRMQPIAAASWRETRDGAAAVAGWRHLRLLAGLVLVSSTVAQVVDLQLGWAVEQATGDLDQRTAVFGNLYSVVGIAAFLFQLAATARIHRHWGVGNATRVLPAVNGLGAAALLVGAAVAPAVVLPLVWALKIADNGLRYSLDQASRELLFQPLPAGQRRRAKAFLDVTVQRSAKGLAALALFAVTFGWISVVSTAWLSLALAIVWLVLTVALERAYVATFRARLHRADAESLDLGDGAVLEAVVAGLGSASSREVLASIELLVAHRRAHLVPPVFLHHADPTVRHRVLELVAAGERPAPLALLLPFLADGAPRIRVAAARAVAAQTVDATGAGEAVDGLHRALSDSEPRVRAAAAGLLARQDGAAAREAAGVLAEMIADADPAVRRHAARALGELPEPRFQAELVALLYDADAGVSGAAIAAVASRARAGKETAAAGTLPTSPLYVPILVSQLRDRRRKHDARDALVAYGAAVLPALELFLADPAEGIWVRRALPKTLARVGGGEATAILARHLTDPDPFLRRKVVEALVTLRRDGGEVPARHLVIDRLAAESHGYLHTLLDLAALAAGRFRLASAAVRWTETAADGRPHLLERLLAERMGHHVEVIAGLLALLHPQHEVRATFRDLGHDDANVRAHAIEFLDSVLPAEERRLVVPVVDDLPLELRLRAARRLFGLDVSSPGAVLRRLVEHRRPGDADAAWLSAAALHYVVDEGPEPPGLLAGAERSEEPLVRSTATHLLADFAATAPRALAG